MKSQIQKRGLFQFHEQAIHLVLYLLPGCNVRKGAASMLRRLSHEMTIGSGPDPHGK